jgi:hypothetical protein
MHKYNGVKQKDKFFVQVSWFVKVFIIKEKGSCRVLNWALDIVPISVLD